MPDRDDYRLFRVTHWIARNSLRLFEARECRSGSGRTILYRLFVPHGYSAGTKYPLVLFLHGSNARGRDNVRNLSDYNALGPAVWLLPEIQRKHPCLVLAPQCPLGDKWVATRWGAPSHVQPKEPTEAMRSAMEVLGRVEREFSVDPDRIYITGQSMGGFGVWDAIARFPERFAAAVPLCGGGDERTARRIAHLPIWAFHGQEDRTAMVSRSRNMVAALRRAGGRPRYTEYVGVGHYVFVHAYLERELFEWLFAQRRTGRRHRMR